MAHDGVIDLAEPQTTWGFAAHLVELGMLPEPDTAAHQGGGAHGVVGTVSR